MQSVTDAIPASFSRIQSFIIGAIDRLMPSATLMRLGNSRGIAIHQQLFYPIEIVTVAQRIDMIGAAQDHSEHLAPQR